MSTTRISKSTIGLLASTCIAASLASMVFAAPAYAVPPQLPTGPYPLEISMPRCQEELARQIAELTQMAAQKAGELVQYQEALSADQAALKAADAAGEPAIDLARAVSDEEFAIGTLQRQLEQIAAALRGDSLLALPPCDPPVTSVPVTPGIGGGFVPPIADPPPTVDPPTGNTGKNDGPPPTVDPPARPTSGFVNPPSTPKVVPLPPGWWERVKRGCREFFECQTEEDLKQDHEAALQQARKEREAESHSGQTGTTRDAGGALRTDAHDAGNGKQGGIAHNEETRSAHVSHKTEVRTSSPTRDRTTARNTGATRMNRMHTAGLGGSHMGGFGGMHMGGLGGMHIAGFGGMHMGGFGRR